MAFCKHRHGQEKSNEHLETRQRASVNHSDLQEGVRMVGIGKAELLLETVWPNFSRRKIVDEEQTNIFRKKGPFTFFCVKLEKIKGNPIMRVHCLHMRDMMLFCRGRRGLAASRPRNATSPNLLLSLSPGRFLRLTLLFFLHSGMHVFRVETCTHFGSFFSPEECWRWTFYS